ncbi:MAG: acetyl-CoA carboxylase carboxyltransferase subunit alpha [Christensenellales bacterium]
MKRLTSRFYIDMLISDFIELHGDRLYGDDAAIIGGVGWLVDIPVTVIAQEKGANVSERYSRNFGSVHPEGYRKALRLMRQAEKFHRPVICFVDTQGAYCGTGAEERGIGEAIARNLMEMSAIKVPIICVILSEGGSGGALALAVADRVAQLENAVYSVVSPEGCATILWKDANRAPEAAQLLKITSYEAKKLGVIDDVIEEPPGGTQENPQVVVEMLKYYLIKWIDRMQDLSVETMLEKRYEKIRSFGNEYLNSQRRAEKK